MNEFVGWMGWVLFAFTFLALVRIVWLVHQDQKFFDQLIYEQILAQQLATKIEAELPPPAVTVSHVSREVIGLYKGHEIYSHVLLSDGRYFEYESILNVAPNGLILVNNVMDVHFVMHECLVYRQVGQPSPEADLVPFGVNNSILSESCS